MSDLGVSQTQVDITSEVDFQKLLSNANPDIVINLVSLSSVALCEKNTHLSEEINLTLVKKMVSQVENFASKSSREIQFVQASSSEMFDRQKLNLETFRVREIGDLQEII